MKRTQSRTLLSGTKGELPGTEEAWYLSGCE